MEANVNGRETDPTWNQFCSSQLQQITLSAEETGRSLVGTPSSCPLSAHSPCLSNFSWLSSRLRDHLWGVAPDLSHLPVPWPWNCSPWAHCSFSIEFLLRKLWNRIKMILYVTMSIIVWICKFRLPGNIHVETLTAKWWLWEAMRSRERSSHDEVVSHRGDTQRCTSLPPGEDSGQIGGYKPGRGLTRHRVCWCSGPERPVSRTVGDKCLLFLSLSWLSL